MKEIAILCDKLDIPREIVERIIQYDVWIDYASLEDTIAELFLPKRWDKGIEEVRAYLGEDPFGFKMLTCMLHCLSTTHTVYQEYHISDQIYIETMKCFGRYLNEHQKTYGYYAFDQEQWVVRQISARLFRIKELEFELIDWNRQQYISIHVPGDVQLTEEKLIDSFWEARQFFREHFPAYCEKPMRGAGWLLSPTLKKLLPPTSNILKFQNFFLIEKNNAVYQYKKWVFKRDDLPLEEMPDTTLLQRNLKTYLLQGNEFVGAHGYLKRTVFDMHGEDGGKNFFRWIGHGLADSADILKRSQIVRFCKRQLYRPYDLVRKIYMQLTYRAVLSEISFCRKKIIALTFDDGYGDALQIFRKLEQYQVKATFFVSGIWIEQEYNIFQKISDAGHEIANHTYSHLNAAEVSESELLKDIDKNQRLLYQITGKKNRLFRFPYHIYNKRLVHAVANAGLLSIGWTIDPRDWVGISAEEIHKRVAENGKIENGAIILMHTYGKHTAEALDLIIPALQSRGYEMTTLSELLNEVLFYRHILKSCEKRKSIE